MESLSRLRVTIPTRDIENGNDPSEIMTSDYIDDIASSAEHQACNLKHKNIMEYSNVSMDIVNNVLTFVIVMPLFDLDLWKYLKNKTNTTIEMITRVQLFECILDGLIYIQRSGMKHLDIKPSNILVKLDSSGVFDGVNCVITDFGIGGKTKAENFL